MAYANETYPAVRAAERAPPPNRRTFLGRAARSVFALALAPLRSLGGRGPGAGAGGLPTASPAAAPVQATSPVAPPAPFGPVPSARQLRWHEMEVNGFLHFGVNTFTDREWGYGDASPSIFDPTEFDADQIVEAARAGGMRGLILTCKHHDGFCLWPSRYTRHSVAASPWRGGKGDVVKEVSGACERQGVRFGVYLSPWDRNRADYGRPSYLTYYRDQLRELLTGYGPIYEVFFDGANGGDGFYGGAHETRRIDRKTYYDWPTTWSLVRTLQPDAVMFSDAGPDVRWVGNERGVAGETCWDTLNRADFVPGEADPARLNRGDRPGTDWVPPESDVSIRPGWFYHANEDGKVKSPSELVDLYDSSVGRGASLLLNVPPDRRGRIHEEDAHALAGFRRALDAMSSTNHAARAGAAASNERGGGQDRRFVASNVLDGRRDTYWASDDEVHTPELVLDFGRPVTFDAVRLREHLPLGQRIEAFALDAWRAGGWTEFARGTSVGSCRLLRPARVTATRLRLRITRAPVCPAVAEVAVFEA